MTTRLKQFDAAALLDAFAESVCLTDGAIDDPRILYVNPAFEAMTGYSAEEVLGRNPKLLQGVDTDTSVFRSMRRLLLTGRLWMGTALNYRKDGTPFMMEWSIRPLPGPDGTPKAFLALQRDITDRHRNNRRLERAHQMLRGILRLPVTTFRLNSAGDVTEAAGGGLDRFPLAGRNLLEEFKDQHDELLTALQGGTVSFEARQLEQVHQVYLDHDALEGSGAVGFSVDITERKDAEERASRTALIDATTGLYNAHGFEQIVAPKLGSRQGAIGWIAVLRIDDYETLLGTLGPEDMVELVRAVARRLRAGVDDAVLLARLFEGTFALAMPNVASRSGEARLDQLIDQLRSTFILGDLPVSVQAVGGLAAYPLDGPDVSTLIAAAKIAVNAAGRQFGARLCRYQRDMQDQMARARRIADRLRLGIAKRQLALVFQPKVTTSSGRIYGVEALVRWSDAQLGTVNPGEFIPIAETSGLIVPLGEWVALEAIETQIAWTEAGFDIPIAINVSAEQLRRQRRSCEFRDFLIAAANDAGMARDRLHLELTESSFADLSALTEVEHLHAAGFTIVVDDFGKDHSTLGLLQRIPAAVLKVDKQFIDEVDSLTDATRSRFLLQKIIELGQGLGMEVVAEGVETQSQHHVLRDLGCDIVQGYLFARPMEAADIPALLRRANHSVPSHEAAAE